jgi:hypothetical protein
MKELLVAFVFLALSGGGILASSGTSIINSSNNGIYNNTSGIIINSGATARDQGNGTTTAPNGQP